jgi:uroporphyrin-III C-methyltransferase/precorrin-2 dehydrogenase/sirohydrochlorin ferrochelatase
MPDSMPAAIIQQGTTPQQRVFIGTLDTLPELAEQEEIKPPSMLIIGEVVRLHEHLAWYEPASSPKDIKS